MVNAKSKIQKAAKNVAIKKTVTIPATRNGKTGVTAADKYRLPELTAGTHVAVPATDEAVKEVRQTVANYRCTKKDVLASKGIKLVTRIFEEDGEKQIGVFAVGAKKGAEQTAE